jgi:hypothetical protein
MMQKSILTLAIVTAMTSTAAMAASDNVQGGSSGSLVLTGASTHSWFDKGNSGLRLNNSSAGYIDLADGPIRGSNAAIAEQGNGGYLQPKHVLGGILGFPNIAQVWKDEASVSGATEYANFTVNSIRQITTLSLAPQFGGLVIGQVGENTSNVDGPADPVVPLAVGSGVYFGEWAPRVGSPAASGTDLNMTSAERTVWYVGDNAVTSMPTAIDATYGVIGISQTGTDASGVTLAGGLPNNLNLYTGQLDVTYASGSGSITNSITRGADSINFAGTTINSNGTFNNGTTIEGRFYNGAQALAGMYTDGAVADVAFGGSKISGTITP